jgi:hypothetical protein
MQCGTLIYITATDRDGKMKKSINMHSINFKYFETQFDRISRESFYGECRGCNSVRCIRISQLLRRSRLFPVIIAT